MQNTIQQNSQLIQETTWIKSGQNLFIFKIQHQKTIIMVLLIELYYRGSSYRTFGN